MFSQQNSLCPKLRQIQIIKCHYCFLIFVLKVNIATNTCHSTVTCKVLLNRPQHYWIGPNVFVISKFKFDKNINKIWRLAWVEHIWNGPTSGPFQMAMAVAWHGDMGIPPRLYNSKPVPNHWYFLDYLLLILVSWDALSSNLVFSIYYSWWYFVLPWIYPRNTN